MSEVTKLSLTKTAQLIAARELSALEATDAYLHAIDQLDDQLGCYLNVDHDGARGQAGRIDAALARGEDCGLLAGVPVGIKDMLVTEGLETTAASKLLKGWIPPYDGTAVNRLRQAGAVILGKQNLDEFAMGSSNENSAFKICRNPWDTDRVPGGSSGASAAAVAAGLCAGSLGTDTGGSVRQPASFCGVVGLKPTYGRVSRYGVIAFASSLDQVGPITRTVSDAARLLQAIAGRDPHDATTLVQDVPDYVTEMTANITGLRIGIPREFLAGELDADVATAFDNARQALQDRGAVVTEISLPHTEHSLPTYYLIAPAEASSNLARFDGIRFGNRIASATAGQADGDELAALYAHTRGQGFGPEVKRRIMLGTYALRAGYCDAYYTKAQKLRALIQYDYQRAWHDVDVVMSPTAPTSAFAIGAKTRNPVDMYLSDVMTLSCNLAGLPGISVPCGFCRDGLPIGLQFMAPMRDELSLLRVGLATEEIFGVMAGKRPEVSA